MIWCRVNAIKLLPDRSSCRDLRLKSVASSVRETCCIWSPNCDINHNQTVKSENVRIVKSSVRHFICQLYYHQTYFTREVSWLHWCRQRFRDNSWLQQTLCKQFEVARCENLFWKEETILCQQHGYGSMTRASPTFEFPGHFCCKNISTFNKKWSNTNDSKLKTISMQQCCLSRKLNIRNLSQNIKIQDCIKIIFICSLQPWQKQIRSITPQPEWLSVLPLYISLNTHLCTLDSNWFVWQYLNWLFIINGKHYYSQQKLICDGLFWKEG